MRKITLLIASLFIAIGAMAQVNYWPTNAPEHNNKKDRDRDMTSVVLGSTTYDLTAAEKAKGYVDKYDDLTFEVQPGATYDLEINTGGSWIHGSVFVDFGGDGFTAGVTDSWKPTEDLVSYAFYNNNSSSDNSGWNSVGTVISGDNRNRPAIPSWTVPADLAPGEYRIRFKLDWCNIDPQGDADGKFSDFYDNRGSILDAKLVVKGQTFNVTYNYKEGDKLITSVEHKVAEGLQYPDLPVATELPYGVTITGSKPEGVVTSDKEHDIAVTIDLPFEFAATFGEIGNNWYYLSIGQSGRKLYYDPTLNYIPLDRTEVDKENINAYLWAFVGNPFEGYKLVNKSKGENFILSASTNTFDNNTGGNTYPFLIDEPVAESKNTYWIPTASPHLGEGGFYLAQKDANNGNNKMNNRDDKLAFWNAGADHGSTFKVRHMLEMDPVNFNWTNTTAWTNVDAETCASSVMWDNKYTEGISYIASEDFDIETPQNATVSFAYTDGDCRLNILGVEVLNSNGDVISSDYHKGFAGGSHVDNIYNVKCVEAGTYKIRCYATEGDWADEGGVVHTDDFNRSNGTITVEFTSTDASEFTHNVTFAARYATLYLGHKVAIPSGVKVYVATSANKNFVHLEEISEVIPATTPVILENVGEDTEYAFVYTTDNTSTIETNLLKGSLANRYVHEDAYVLAKIDTDVVGFGIASKNQLDGGAFLNNANKVYLPASAVPQASQVQALFFNVGETTGVEEVEVESTVKTIYDLSGRKVSGMSAPGLYIVNGKKVLVK